MPEKQATLRAWKSWGQVAPLTGLFIVMGILMAVSGMAAFLAQALAEIGRAYLPIAPFVGAVGGFVTGSNTGVSGNPIIPTCGNRKIPTHHCEGDSDGSGKPTDDRT